MSYFAEASLPARETSQAALIFRTIVFALAAFYAVRMVVTNPLIEEPFGPFRWLTYWANLAAVACAWVMLGRSRAVHDRRFDGLVSATAVVGAMVVYLYWSLYFKDPLSVNTELPSSPWTEYYYHLAGPLLQWIDALFVLRAFRAPVKAVAWLVGLIVAWLTFIELAVQPLNDTPAGSVTSGLPYPFLNNMELAERLPFYGMNIAVALVLLALFSLIAFGIRRLFR